MRKKLKTYIQAYSIYFVNDKNTLNKKLTQFAKRMRNDNRNGLG